MGRIGGNKKHFHRMHPIRVKKSRRSINKLPFISDIDHHRSIASRSPRRHDNGSRWRHFISEKEFKGNEIQLGSITII